MSDGSLEAPMAQKLFSLDEAAEILGIPADELTGLREANKVFGVRVGSDWKFKPQEIERFAAERALGESSGVNLPTEAEQTVDVASSENLATGSQKSDVVLLSERELGESMPSSSSTIIGRRPNPADMPGTAAAAGSDVKLVVDAPGGKSDSDVKLVAGGSSATVVGKFPPEEDEEVVDLTLDDSRTGSGAVAVDLAGGSSTGSSVIGGQASGAAGGSDALVLGEEGLALGSSAARKQEGQLDLGDDLVLGSLSGSDVTLNPGDSGIALANPADSGLNLEEPLELGTEDSDLAAVGSDPTFDLSIDERTEEDSSGSQVIALGDDTAFDDSGATMLGSDDMTAALVEDAPADAGMAPTIGMAPGAIPGMAPGMMPGMAPGMGPGMMPGMAPGMAPGAAPGMAPGAYLPAVEASYSIWNVLSLATCLIILTLVGMMMYDLMRNVWYFDKPPLQVSSSLTDAIAGLFK
jgi:hypothetical protein